MLTDRITALFIDYFGGPPEFIARAPGRVNLLGDHLDYNDGPVLPVAIDREVTIAARQSTDKNVTVRALDWDAPVAFSLENLEAKKDLSGQSLPAWTSFPAGVAWSLMEAGYKVNGFQAMVASNLPVGAGLGSSAALEVGFATLWGAIGGWEADPIELARICQHAKNQYVGVDDGLAGQFASACGVRGHVLYLDTRSLEWRPIPFFPGTVIVIADSGVRSSRANSAASDRQAACEQAVQLLAEYVSGLESLRDISAPEFAAYSAFLPLEIARRAEHVVKEIARVNTAVSGLQRDDAQALGALLYASHNSLRYLYEVSCPELDALVEIARGLPGCIGARMTGAGFGGCTVNLVQAEYADPFIRELKRGYQQQVEREAQVYLCRANRGAVAESL